MKSVEINAGEIFPIIVIAAVTKNTEKRGQINWLSLNCPMLKLKLKIKNVYWLSNDLNGR